MLKKDLRPALGVTVLLVGALVGYCTTTPSRTPDVARLDTSRSNDAADVSVAHKRISALESLILRYREELTYVDGVNNDLEQKINH